MLELYSYSLRQACACHQQRAGLHAILVPLPYEARLSEVVYNSASTLSSVADTCYVELSQRYVLLL